MFGGQLDPRVGEISFTWSIGTDHTGRTMTVQTVWWPGAGHPLKGAIVTTRFSWSVKALISVPAITGTERTPAATTWSTPTASEAGDVTPIQ
ncbi:hypothetical protein ACQP10_34805 [Streptosporangium sandarakinum]|uniref:hypothetical protein n=1 Tax=Streptosporangium sandarakinum TaxID=1260955 RepID=UPI003D8DE603